MKEVYSCNTLWEIEDMLDQARVFVNGLDNRPASMCAYMTCIDFEALVTFLNNHFDQYSKEVWKECCSYWLHISYLSPIPAILSHFITRTRLS